MRTLFRKFLAWWHPIAEHIVRVQTAIILTLVYLVSIGPLSILARIFRQDLLEKRLPRNAATFWHDKPPLGEDVAPYRQQF